MQPVVPNPFRVGMKLEAVDKKNNSLICVATVADVLGDRLLVRFDGWEDTYDYWCDPTSPYIHPIGWCKENSEALSPPCGKFILFEFYQHMQNCSHFEWILKYMFIGMFIC